MEHAEAHDAGDHVAAFARARLAMWLFLASEIMMFGAFIACYVVLWTGMPDYPNPEDSPFFKGALNWKLACLNTAILIFSSYTMVRAVHAISKGDRAHCEDMLILTGSLGLLFLVVKGFEYAAKFSHGIGPSTNVFYSCYFLMTGFHGIHVLIGVIVLFVLAFLSKKFDAHHYAHVENTALYWHFVDLVWIFLFPIVYLL